jgi:uncharacterized protein YkwD
MSVAAALAVASGLTVFAPPASASVSYDMEQQILSLMNADRSRAGLVPYRRWMPLAVVAGHRASRMASKNVLSHSAAGPNLGSELTSNGAQWYTWGEAIGWTSYHWGSKAAANLYSMWKASAPHRALMMSAGFNYVGIGVAYRSSNGRTFASIVFSDSKDHTGATASHGAIAASGTTLGFGWTGWDPKLQKRTAGLRSFDLQYRVDSGGWSTIRNDTTTTSISLADRARGHWYGFRVQAADLRGNLGKWTSETRVWVP